MLIWFYCDASYDSDPQQDRNFLGQNYVSRTFVVGGFLAKKSVWNRIQQDWMDCNIRAGVSRYHAANVNARDGEFDGWSKERLNEYSGRLLTILGREGRDLCSISMGLKVRDYQRVISEGGRRKWGNPYVVCFKQCIAYIAQLLDNLPPEYQFSVVLERDNSFEKAASDIFYQMKDDRHWGYGKRLGTCTPGNPEEIIPLQPADLIAYETFRYLDSNRDLEKVRYALKELLPHNVLLGKWWNAELLSGMKKLLETAPVEENKFIALWDEEDLSKDRFVIG